MNKTTENVTCGICGRDTTVKAWESAPCECGVRIFSTPELRAKVTELRKQALALQVEAATHERELFYREKRNIMKDINGKPLSDTEFWAGVHGKPREAAEKAAKTASARTPKVKGDEGLL